MVPIDKRHAFIRVCLIVDQQSQIDGTAGLT